MPVGERQRQPGRLFALSDKNLLVGIGRLVIGSRHCFASSRASGYLVDFYIASCPPIETGDGPYVSIHLPHRSRFSGIFLQTSAKKPGTQRNSLCETGIHSCIAATLAPRSRIKTALVA
jgi:hypothetical protein